MALISNEARALSTFYSLSAGLEPAVIERIKNSCLTQPDLENFEIRQARGAWNDYLSETRGEIESVGKPIHMPA